MPRFRFLPVALAVLSAACQPTRQDTGGAYRCADGRMVRVTYEEGDHALLVIDGKPRRLAIALSASGARYVGEGWQWWTKGMRDAWLAPLRPGEAIAAAPGVGCRMEGKP